MGKKLFFGIIALILILILVLSFTINESKVNNVEPSPKNVEYNWDEITLNGVDEQKLFENINTDDLEQIASLLQNLEREIEEKEKEDFKFVFEAKWYEYTLNSKQFDEVLKMGDKAVKPLYTIIYKSPNAGLYEYICCMALQRITNYQLEDWHNSKDFLEKFNKYIYENKK